MNLQERTEILTRLKDYMLSGDTGWKNIQRQAAENNAWFIPEFITHAIQQIAHNFLDREKLDAWTKHYNIPPLQDKIYNIGIVMAGNIPLVGFFDFLCAFISGHSQTIKMSSKDNILLKHLTDKMTEWKSEMGALVQYAEMLKGCDAYIATGSNNSARYFNYYFRKFPHIIRKNRTSVAIIKGNETTADLEKLADDVYLYFGMGCRNVTQIYVPRQYDFVPLLDVFRIKYDYLIENHKYKHNYDFNLAMHIVNQKFYMTNGSVLLSENASPFSPVSQLNYQFYTTPDEIYAHLSPEEIQCIAGIEKLPFGAAQAPSLYDYADDVDTMLFLQKLADTKAA
ncbi:MAG: acyl-CoA reductase [Chitinophagaceae bacterium]|nr:acyl-CoA reductase [Chitinophagaceae bacterium]